MSWDSSLRETDYGDYSPLTDLNLNHLAMLAGLIIDSKLSSPSPSLLDMSTKVKHDILIQGYKNAHFLFNMYASYCNLKYSYQSEGQVGLLV